MEPLNWKTEKRIVRDLIPWEHNPRQMTRKQAEDLSRSVERFNLVEIPAINTDNMVIAGHQRLMVLKLLGREGEEIDVRVPNRPLTADEFKEYNIRSNQNHANWDFNMLSSNYELPKLLEFGFTESKLGIIESPLKKICEECKRKVVDLGTICICSLQKL